MGRETGPGHDDVDQPIEIHDVGLDDMAVGQVQYSNDPTQQLAPFSRPVDHDKFRIGETYRQGNAGETNPTTQIPNRGRILGEMGGKQQGIAEMPTIQ
jgi:hypothetical protein